ncbi:MAG: hypothetical protein HKN63_03225 [Rhodobacteraceae bacterium]|nr:hypothetical protein [Paracoccaceae bacterium]
MSSEVIFHKKVNERRVQFSEVGRPGFIARAVLYVNAACANGEELGIEGLPVKRISVTDGNEEIHENLLKLEEFMDVIRARHLFAIEPDLREASVQLDKDWKVKASTLVSHIRDIVAKAEMEEGLREPIMRSLNQLQSEIDRNRTRLDLVSAAWLQLTSAIGNGAKNLEPAVKLVERLSKALGKAKRHEIEAEQHPQLPPPDDLENDD